MFQLLAKMVSPSLFAFSFPPTYISHTFAKGWTPLHCVCEGKLYELQNGSTQNRIEVVRMLLAEPNLKVRTNKTLDSFITYYLLLIIYYLLFIICYLFLLLLFLINRLTSKQLPQEIQHCMSWCSVMNTLNWMPLLI
jgi:hypothetical protein